MNDPLHSLIGEIVVLDTANPIIYIGTLIEVSDHTLVMANTDMHDCRDGHATKEQYVAQTRGDDVSVNRRSVIVMRSIVISVSRLTDVVRE